MERLPTDKNKKLYGSQGQLPLANGFIKLNVTARRNYTLACACFRHGTVCYKIREM